MHARAVEPASTAVLETRQILRIEWFTRRVLKRLRELNLEIGQLATRMGYDRSMVSKMFRSERINALQFQRFCTALEVDDYEWWHQPPGPVVRGFDAKAWERSMKAEAARIARDQERKGRRR